LNDEGTFVDEPVTLTGPSTSVGCQRTCSHCERVRQTSPAESDRDPLGQKKGLPGVTLEGHVCMNAVPLG